MIPHKLCRRLSSKDRKVETSFDSALEPAQTMQEIDLQGMSRKEQEECIRETRVLSSLDSDFIIKYYDSFLERVRNACFLSTLSCMLGVM